MGRLVRVLFGFVVACLAAAYTKLLFAMPPAEIAALPGDVMLDRLGDVLSRGWKYGVLFALFSVPFAVIALAIGEWRRIRGWQYYTLTGIAISMVGYVARYNGELPGDPTIVNNYALAAYVTTGLVAGLLYWLVAGRSAGGHTLPEAQSERVPAAVAPTKPMADKKPVAPPKTPSGAEGTGAATAAVADKGARPENPATSVPAAGTKKN